MAQAKSIASHFAENGYASWTASTVHSQQGAESDIVIFDTVNASSTSWPIHEWLRLVNVGLSRAREYVILIASRSEMQSPYLKPLLRSLRPVVLNRVGSAWRWSEVSANAEYQLPDSVTSNLDLLGTQIALRKALRPVLSYDQQRLCGFEMDGKPRLVRGVAGSGKTVVLGHWLRKTLDRIDHNLTAKVWAVFANRSLRQLLQETIESAWNEDKGDQPFPWHRVELWHVRDLLDLLLREVGKSMSQFGFEYDQASEAYLIAKNDQKIMPRCHALFADEGQDLGPSTLKLLTALVDHGDPELPNCRSVNIFYDNAQNIYSRSMPKWSEMGLDMRGRSTIMKESFRATKPVTEFAFNLLHRLCPEEAKNADHKELVELGLVHAGKREGRPWWDILFTHIDGPSPIFKKFPNKEAEFDAIGKQLVHWIKDEGVKPSEICILYMQDYPKYKLENQVKPMLARIGVDLQVLKGQARPPDERTVIATTPHSFKGYDSEIVLIPLVEFFESGGKPLARVLYVAMTRARSLLAIYGKASKKEGQREIVEALDECLDALEARPPVEAAASESDEHEDILLAVGIEFKKWLDETKRSHRLIQEPMLASDGTILCEPLFWYESDGRRYVCFPKGKPSQRIKNALEDARVTILEPQKD